jgi:hypothetical protein
MPGHGPARPGTPSRPDGVPQRATREKEEKWERVPTRSVALLRLFFAILVLSMAAATIMIIHLLMPAFRMRTVYSASRR